MPNTPASRPGPSHSKFPQTRWSLIKAAYQDDDEAAWKALNELCELYWFPIYAFVRDVRHYSHQEAQDSAQGFVSFLLEKETLRNACPAKGSFRSFLCASLKNFLSVQRRHSNAARRGGTESHLSMDAEHAERLYLSEASTNLAPDLLFDRRWVQSLLDHAQEDLRRQYGAKGKEREFEVLSPALVPNGRELAYRAMASDLGVEVGTARVEAFRLRRRYRDLIVKRVQETVGSLEEVLNEVDYLFSVCGASWSEYASPL